MDKEALKEYLKENLDIHIMLNYKSEWGISSNEEFLVVTSKISLEGEDIATSEDYIKMH